MMTHEKFQDVIVDIIKNNFGFDISIQIEMDTDLRQDLGMSNLDLIELIFTMEELCSIEVEDGHHGKLKTVGDLHSYFATHSSIVS